MVTLDDSSVILIQQWFAKENNTDSFVLKVEYSWHFAVLAVVTLCVHLYTYVKIANDSLSVNRLKS